MAAKFETKSYKTITFEEMADFIEKNHPEDKEWFKEVAFQDKNGKKLEKYNHLNAKLKFCEKYAPELIPQAAPKNKVTKRLENW